MMLEEGCPFLGRDRGMVMPENLLLRLVEIPGGEKVPDLSPSRAAEAFFMALSSPFPGKMRAIVLKDIKPFFRDTSQWSQLFLIFALMVVYISVSNSSPLERAATA